MTTVNNPKVSTPSGKENEPQEKGFFNRPRAGGKSFWDWLNLLGILAIPIILGIATLLFGIQQAHLADLQHQSDQRIAQQQHEADQQSVLDQQRQATLVTYLDTMNNLLLNRGLLTSKPGDEIRIIAHTETLSAMRQLDGKRNSFLVQFLQDASLIGKDHNIVSFNNADLSDTDLRGANLDGTDLSNANLIRANLGYADLRGAILTNSVLTTADLSDTLLISADLRDAVLYKTILRDADLTHADLTYANFEAANLTSASLVSANFNQTSLLYANLADALQLHFLS